MSRLFVSSYAAYFVVYTAFLTYSYTVLLNLSRNEFFRWPPPVHVYIILLILLLDAGFALRARGFGAVLERIEKGWTVTDGAKRVDIRHYFWPQGWQWILRYLSEYLGIIVVIVTGAMVPVMMWFYLPP